MIDQFQLILSFRLFVQIHLFLIKIKFLVKNQEPENMSKTALAVLLKAKQLVSLIVSKEALNSILFVRVVTILLLFAMMAPMFFIGEFGVAKAQTNVPFQKSAPVSAPPEPYIFSSGGYSGSCCPRQYDFERLFIRRVIHSRTDDA
jgi:hypothetical protein